MSAPDIINGPWTVFHTNDNHFAQVLDADEKRVVWVQSVCSKTDAQADIRADLIAAAPELYALVVVALDLIPRMSGHDFAAPALTDWCEQARAVLAKAGRPD
jgi:hypothetical protein